MIRIFLMELSVGYQRISAETSLIRILSHSYFKACG